MDGKLRSARAAGLLTLSLLMPLNASEAKKLGPPEPDPGKGAVAVTVRGRFPLGQKSPAVQVYFARCGEDVDMFSAESVIPSNYSEKKQVYLLNAKPGRYVAVGAQLRNLGTIVGDFMVFFDRATIAQTEVEVAAGRMTFMGDLFVDLKVNMNKADEAQAHYYQVIEPEVSRMGFSGRALSREYMYTGELIELDRTAATEAEYWTLARDKTFGDARGWRAMVELQMAAGNDQ